MNRLDRLLITALFILSADAASAQRLTGTRLFVLAAGEIPSANGGQFETDLQLTNFVKQKTKVSLRFVPTGIGATALPPISITLESMEIRFLANVTRLFTRERMVGTIVVDASREIAGAAFIRHRNRDGWSDEEHRAMFDAIPLTLAIRRGETTTIHGVRPRYNAFVVETAGRHVELLFELTDAKRRVVATQTQAMPGNAHIIVNIGAMANLKEISGARIRCTVVRGEGAVLIAGSQSDPGSMVSTPHRMSFDHQKRGLPQEERMIYAGLAALALASSIAGRYSRL